MRKKIVGVTVGTTINPKTLEKKLKPVKTVNGVEPDENGNVQVAGTADAVQANLDAHNQSKKNPHTWKPTAAEVGARPDTWTPTAQDVGAVPNTGGTMTGGLDVNGGLASFYGTDFDANFVANGKNGYHRLFITNPDKVSAITDIAMLMKHDANGDLYYKLYGEHNKPSASDVGAAPAGYGLGGNSKMLTSADNLDNITADGWYTWSDIPQGFSYGACVMQVKNHTQHWLVQEATNLTPYTNCKMVRSCLNKVWQPWEWENPPMMLDVEYRTTERWNGSPVYRKIVSHTNSVAYKGNATYEIPHGISNLNLNTVEIVMKTSGYCMPYHGPDGTTDIRFFDSTKLYLRTSGDVEWSPSRNWYFEMKYTKIG